MGDRYQKSTKPGDGAKSVLRKSGIGMLWARICTRLGIGSGEEKRTYHIPVTGTGYQTQGRFEDDDDGRISRRRPGSGFNPMTGTYTTGNSEPSGKRTIWPWIVLAFAAIGLFSFVFKPSDPVNPSPSGSRPAVEAMTNTSKPADEQWQHVATTNAPKLTPKPSPTPLVTPAPTPTPTPEAASSVLKYGSNGEAVKYLQTQLIALGYMAQGKDDGAFGDITLSAVQSFQKVNSLDADGIAGEKTLALLDSGTAKEDPDVFVWVENKGKVYHSNKDCSEVKDPRQLKLSQAEKRKLIPCDKCP